MVTGPGAGAEGGEQTGRGRPDLRLWPELGIPAQRADETSAAMRSGSDPGSGPGVTPGILSGNSPLPTPSRTPRQIGPADSGDSYFNPGALDGAAPGGQPGDATSASATSTPFAAAVPPTGARPELPAAPAATPFIPEQVAPAAPIAPFVPGQAAPETAAAFGSVPVAAAPAPAPAPLAEPEILAARPETAAETSAETKRRKLRSDRHSHRSRMRRQTSAGIVALSCLAVTFLVLHRFLPDAGGIGSLLESWLPWVGVPVVVLLLAAAVVHTKTALIVTFAAALVWTALYGPMLLPRGSSATAQLRIFSEDVNGDAQEATASGTMALAQHAGVVALEDMYSSVYESDAVDALNSAYPNHVTEYEFGLWSTYPITNAEPITLGTTQSAESLSVGTDSAGLAASASDVPVIGALKATLTTPDGPLVVYLVHLPQPVLGDQGFAKARDQALTQFVQLLEADHSTRLAVIGDINVAATDRQFSQLTRDDGLTSAQQAAGSGFGFTWPAEFPFVRLDDVLTRGLKPLRSVVLPSIAKGQTHLPIQVDLDY